MHTAVIEIDVVAVGAELQAVEVIWEWNQSKIEVNDSHLASDMQPLKLLNTEHVYLRDKAESVVFFNGVRLISH